MSPINRVSNTTNNMVRRCTLTTDPTINVVTGVPMVTGLDTRGLQWQIVLDVLPPGVTVNMIKAGQQWFVERRTSYNRLFMYCGQFTPYSQLRVSSTGYPLAVANQWYNVPFTKNIVVKSGTCGVTKVSGNQFVVPIPGLYSVNWNTQISPTGSTRLYSSTLDFSSSYSTGTVGNDILCLTSGNLTFSIQSQSPGTTVSGVFIPGTSSGWVAITFVGPVI